MIRKPAQGVGRWGGSVTFYGVVYKVVEGGQSVGGGGDSEASYSGFERAIGCDFEGESDVGALGGVEQEADGAAQRMRGGVGEEAGEWWWWGGGGGRGTFEERRRTRLQRR